MSERIIIRIDPSGNPTIKVEGHPGPGCKDITKAVEKALGTVVSDKTTNEYSLPAQAEASRHVNC
jgi:hypothetical protein